MMKTTTQPEQPGKPVETAAPAATPNVLQRAETVLKKLKLAPPVAAGVLAAHGLTRTALVDPEVLQAQVTAWLAAPAKR
ncbi:MAG: hypothetical protein WC326_08130 [Candidatus Delongbacteria bacterium]